MRQIEVSPEGGAASLRVHDAPMPVPRAGELLIGVDYAGVNRPDLLQRDGKYPPPPDASPVLGLEVAGHVVALVRRKCWAKVKAVKVKPSDRLSFPATIAAAVRFNS